MPDLRCCRQACKHANKLLNPQHPLQVTLHSRARANHPGICSRSECNSANASAKATRPHRAFIQPDL
eukprot:5072713-Alexandrium_andersonii.AAC.1